MNPIDQENAMPNTIDLNCDAAEISREIDDSMLPHVTSCNVCCGAHAGDHELIEGTIRKAIELGVYIGAHPSYPDREHFGRKTMDLSIEKLRTSVLEQIAFVKQLTESLGGTLQHVKPHGALYHDVVRDERLAAMFIDGVSSIDSRLAIYGQADSTFAAACSEKGVRFVHEAFGDRSYESKLALRSRIHDDALLCSETDFRDQIQRLLDGEVIDIHGQTRRLTVQSICLHSDTPNAVNFARIAHEIIQQHN